MNADPRILLRDGPMTMFQIVVVMICTVLNMIDGFDVLCMSFTAPLVAKEFNLDPAALGGLLSAGLFGMCIGSLTLSPLADVIGRRAVVNLSTVIISIGMFGAGLAGDAWELAILRFVTGLGVGGLLASGNTMLAEYSPTRWRDLSISSMVVGYSGGAIIGGLIAAYIIGAFGWRGAFIFGGVCSTVLLPFGLLFLPESLDFLITHRGPKTLDKINAVMRRLRRPELTSLPDVGPEKTATVIGVFHPRFFKSTVLICTSFFLLMFTFYFVLSWLPKNIVDLGFTAQQGIFASVLLNVGGVIGGLLFGYFAGRSHPRALSPYALAMCFVSVVGLGAISMGYVPLMSASFVVGMCLIGAMASLYGIAPLIYPASVRTTGTGLAIGLGRLGAVAGPAAAGFLIEGHWQRFSYYAVLAIPALLSALAIRRIPLLDEPSSGQISMQRAPAE